jgi:hypothetical protein
MRGEPSAMKWNTRLRTPFARPAATATVRARTVMRTRASTGPVYRQVSTKMQWTRAGLGRNLNPGAFACLNEQTCADQAFNDTSRGVRRYLQRIFDISDRQHGYAVVDDFLDDRADNFGAASVVAAIWQISRSFHCQARFSVRGGTAVGTRGSAWPAMICSSRSGTLSANRYSVSFNEERLRKVYRSSDEPQ